MSDMALTTSGPVMVFLLLFWATEFAEEVAYRTNTLAAWQEYAVRWWKWSDMVWTYLGYGSIGFFGDFARSGKTVFDEFGHWKKVVDEHLMIVHRNIHRLRLVSLNLPVSRPLFSWNINLKIITNIFSANSEPLISKYLIIVNHWYVTNF